MKSLNFTITIDAPISTVRKVMLEHPTYEERTEIFAKWSTYNWSWDQWAEIKFWDGKWSGMLAKIAKNEYHKYISIQHLGEIWKDKKITMYTWESFENYAFTDIDWKKTQVDIEMTAMPDEWVPMFQDLRPKSLEKLKEICKR